MRRLVTVAFLISAVGVFLSAAPAFTQGAGAGEAVLQADQALGRALAAGDSRAGAALLDTQFSFVDREGGTHGGDEVLKNALPRTATPHSDSDVTVRDYGEVATVAGNRRLGDQNVSVRFLHVWVKRAAGWRAMVYHENTIFPPEPAPPAPAPAANPAAARFEPCENPCKVLPYTPRNAEERAITEEYKALETCVATHDADGWAPHMADEFVVIRQRYDGRPETKAGRIGNIRRQKETNAFTNPGKVEWMDIRVFGDAAVMVARHLSVSGKPVPYRVTRVWVKRNGRWQMAISQQTTIVHPASGG